MTYEEGMQNVVEWAQRTVTSDDYWIDVGANRGYITERLFEKVTPRDYLMIEPCPQGTLSERMVRCVVLDKEKIVSLRVPLYQPERSTVSPRKVGGESQLFFSTTIDKMFSSVVAPIVIKIDTEFCEPLVWEGMKETIPKIRAACIEFFPDILRQESNLDPEKFLKDIKDAGFKIEFSGHDMFLSR